jgi:hypothetical protein
MYTDPIGYIYIYIYIIITDRVHVLDSNFRMDIGPCFQPVARVPPEDISIEILVRKHNRTGKPNYRD